MPEVDVRLVDVVKRFGDTAAVKNHLLKAQLDFLERVGQQRRQTSQR